MKKILLYAYLQNNFGDDVMVDILLKHFPQYKFIWGYSRKEQSDRFISYPNFVNITTIHRKWKRLNRLVNFFFPKKKKNMVYTLAEQRSKKKCICSVYIGGSLYTPWENISIEDRVNAEKEKLQIPPLFIIGANFGPFNDNEFYRAFYDYFSQCGGVCFRDRYSYNLFSNLPQVTYAPDVVFNLPFVKSTGQSNRTVAISVINFRTRSDLAQYADSYEQFIVKICDEAIKRELTPQLVSFCDKEGDMKAIEHILCKIDINKKDKIQIVKYESLANMLEIMSHAAHIVATRFHSLILALGYKIPFFCIAYNHKCINVLTDIESDAYCLPDELGRSDLINRVFDYPTMSGNVDTYIQQSFKQFEQLKTFLDG